MIRTSLGLWYTTPVQTAAKPLSFLQSTPLHPEVRHAVRPASHWWSMLSTVSSYARISNFGDEVGGLPRYSRAAGSTGSVLIPRLTPRLALVALPSGQLRLLSNHMYVNQGGLPPSD